MLDFVLSWRCDLQNMYYVCVSFYFYLTNCLYLPFEMRLQKSIISAFGFFLYPITFDWPWRCDFSKDPDFDIYGACVFESSIARYTLVLPSVFSVPRGNIIVYCACVLIFFPCYYATCKNTVICVLKERIAKFLI